MSVAYVSLLGSFVNYKMYESIITFYILYKM